MSSLLIMFLTVLIGFLLVLLYSISKGHKLKKISFKIKDLVSFDAEIQKEKEIVDATNIDHIKNN